MTPHPDHRSLRRCVVRATATLAMLAGLAAPALPARAAALHDSVVTLHVSATTVQVGKPLHIWGRVTPRPVFDESVTVSNFVGGSWQVLDDPFVRPDGTFEVDLRAWTTPQVQMLRVVRFPTDSAKVGYSKIVRLNVVKAGFAVTLAPVVQRPLSAGAALVVSGSVSRHATGLVHLQALANNAWQTIASARLSKKSAFRIRSVRPTGTYRLRVTKDFAPAIGGGVSSPFSASWLGAPGSRSLWPVGAMPPAVVGTRYVAQLSALGGVAPYTWSLTNGALPAGLTLDADGMVSGTPTAAGPAAVSFAVRDAQGRTGTTIATATVAPAAAGVLAWGWGPGLLGAGAVDGGSATPLRLPGLAGVTSVTGSDYNGYATDAHGAVWAWGSNTHGELGNGSTAGSTTPVRVSGLTGVIQVSASQESAVAVKSDGTVWAWGSYSYEAPYLPKGQQSDVPVRIRELPRVVALATSGYDTNYALAADGTVWSWGVDYNEQLGAHNANEGDLRAPLQVEGITDATAIAAGGRNGYALRSDGTVWAWGRNAEGEDGDPGLGGGDTFRAVRVTGLTNVTSITAGSDAAYARRFDGTVWAWGDDVAGDLGDGVALDSSGLHPHPQPVAVAGLSGVTSVAAADGVGFALRSDGTVWGWGANDIGELGTATTASLSATAIRIPGAADVSVLSTSPNAGLVLTPG